MVHSKTEPKSVTFKTNADVRNVRGEASRRNGQEESESDVTSDSVIMDPVSKDSYCVRKDVYKMIQKMAETSVTESADEASSISSVMEMTASKVSNKANETKGEFNEEREGNIRISEANRCKCAYRERIAPNGTCPCDAKRQAENGTQTEGLTLLPWTCLCHYNTVLPLNAPEQMTTICNENRYHRMHVSQVTAPHQDCTCGPSIVLPPRGIEKPVKPPDKSMPSKESFSTIFEPARKKAKKKRKLSPYYNRSSATSIHTVALPGPDGIPVDPINQVQEAGTETKSLKEEVPERVDVYYFDHGNSGYYRTTDRPPAISAEVLMDAADETATKFWADVFGALHIGFAFIINFILQLLRFLLYSVLRPLTVGIFQLIADYFFKPLLTVLFNGVLQPILILLYNIATSLRDLCEPLAAAIGFFLKEIAAVFRAFRIVEVQKIECCHAHKIV